MKRWCVIVLLAFGVARGAEPYPLREAVECRPRRGLPNALVKMTAGKPVRVAYLGGSITAAPGWRPKTLAWFRREYPSATFEEINAAIGGTGSDLGVYRLHHDVLQHKPDLLFVEFAVNDGGAPPERIHRSMEGIVRQTWRADPTIDICFVYTLTENMLKTLQSGKFPRAASAMETLADHYNIPSIHLGVEVARQVTDGKLLFKGPKPRPDDDKPDPNRKVVFSGDGVHPYAETGHEIYTTVIARSMKPIAAVGTPGPHPLPKPFVADNWEKAGLVPLDKATLSSGWKKLATDQGLAKRFGKRLPALWQASKPGDTIAFKFRGTAVGVYDLLGPDCGQVIVKLDDQPERIAKRVDGYCTYHRLGRLTIAGGLEDKLHSVVLTIHPEQPDKRTILHKHRLPDLDKNPGKYDGTSWYAGGILLIGELLR